MRPVNLIPKEERPGGTKPLRSGPLAYVVVGALVAALLGVTALVVADNQVGEKEDEIAQIEGEVATAEAKAQSLAAYTQFHAVREQRVATISSLADSRFDWERVMRELALVLPGNVWLTNLTASASPGTAPTGGSAVSLRAGIPGPALSLIGCTTSQDAVAGFVQALKDIDGVTRVGVQASARGEAGGSVSDSAGSANCKTRDFITQFEMAVAFDAAPPSAVASEAAGAVVAPTAETTEPEGEAE
jgi:Tfp pilus assembly protein PilN